MSNDDTEIIDCDILGQPDNDQDPEVPEVDQSKPNQ